MKYERIEIEIEYLHTMKRTRKQIAGMLEELARDFRVGADPKRVTFPGGTTTQGTVKYLTAGGKPC